MIAEIIMNKLAHYFYFYYLFLFTLMLMDNTCNYTRQLFPFRIFMGCLLFFAFCFVAVNSTFHSVPLEGFGFDLVRVVIVS